MKRTHLLSLIPALLILAGFAAAVAFGSSNGPTTALIAVVGLAASSALSGILGSVAAGAVLRAEGALPIGASISLLDGTSGVVIHVGLRSTLIRDPVSADMIRQPNITLASVRISIHTKGTS